MQNKSVVPGRVTMILSQRVVVTAYVSIRSVRSAFIHSSSPHSLEPFMIRLDLLASRKLGNSKLDEAEARGRRCCTQGQTKNKEHLKMKHVSTY